ncbi:MAG: HIRAN domain-containing protein [Candidatus Sericytochromatia bacterium]
MLAEATRWDYLEIDDAPLLRRATELLLCHVAGTMYRDGIRETARELVIGQALVLRREPHNPYDSRAIAVYTPEGAPLGYVPRSRNAEAATLLDQGEELTAELLSLNWRHDWLWLDMRLLHWQSAPAASRYARKLALRETQNLV